MKIKLVPLPKKESFCFEYSTFPTGLGKILIVTWETSIVYVAFAESGLQALDEAKKLFPKATFQKIENATQKKVLEYLRQPKKSVHELTLAVKKTPFQFSVLKALLKIPFGKTVPYSAIAKTVGKPTAVRAVASAVARNPVAILIPCHRVVPSAGGIGKYHWGTQKKLRLLTWENLNV